MRWLNQIVAWHHALASDGPTKAVNNLKRIERIGFERPVLSRASSRAR